MSFGFLHQSLIQKESKITSKITERKKKKKKKAIHNFFLNKIKIKLIVKKLKFITYINIITHRL